MWLDPDGFSEYSDYLILDGGKDPGTLQDFGVTTAFREAVDTASVDESFPPSPLPAVLVRTRTKLDDREKLPKYVREFKEWMGYSSYPLGRYPKTALLIVAQPEEFDEDVVIGGKHVKKVQGRFTKLVYPPQPVTNLSTPGNRWGAGSTLPTSIREP
ncbi:hypothetical protein PG984_005237 [Apiospora sp. TS-2023a]